MYGGMACCLRCLVQTSILSFKKTLTARGSCSFAPAARCGRAGSSLARPSQHSAEGADMRACAREMCARGHDPTASADHACAAGSAVGARGHPAEERCEVGVAAKNDADLSGGDHIIIASVKKLTCPPCGCEFPRYLRLSSLIQHLQWVPWSCTSDSSRQCQTVSHALR